MKAQLITACLIVVGLINIAPVLGVLSATRLEAAYAVQLADDNLVILMRHRALLFGVLGGFILFSAFAPAYQGAAMVMAGVSMLGFALLVMHQGGYNPSLFKVLIVDLVGIAFLAAAAILTYLVPRS